MEKGNYYQDFKLDIKELKELLNHFAMGFSDKEAKFSEEFEVYMGLASTPSHFLNSSYASYIAPAFFLNQYIDTLNAYTIRDYSNGDRTQLELNLNLYVHSIFSSIKTLIDRLVPLMSFYYRGISLQSTFGRIKSTGKASGLMQKASELKEKDHIMQFIYENYSDWIQRVVSPRDLITHYNDFTNRMQYVADGRAFPIHLEKRLFDNRDEPFDSYELVEPYDHTYKTINKDVIKVYKFINYVISQLVEKEIEVSKQHFVSTKEFEAYVEWRNKRNV
ncbi:hypothetical protein ACQRXC_14995 [Niallia taxi]|uniref:hypothetical protein n=1 Tax=Niallia taxi TaxID=2499688 RepID=UPI003F638535